MVAVTTTTQPDREGAMLVKTNEYEISGNMPGHTESMSLSSDSLEHIMDILSDLYSNRSAAVIREYTTNALDSHLISGQTKPVEISTPNRLNPNLVIRDFGTGMSKQVLIDTYSKYGASTKRGNNIEAGQLGLGSKSGFAYTDQFIVRSIHDGHCCEIIMSRNDRGAAEMNIAMEYETDDENGVTITVPIASADVDSVKQEVQNFAAYANPGTILVDGVLNKFPEELEKLGHNLYATTNANHHVIVMGNVTYRADKLFESVWIPWNGKYLVAFVEMGEVDFTPSREELKYTQHTLDTVYKIEEYLNEILRDKVKDAISGNQTRYEQISKLIELNSWSSFVDVHGLPEVQKLSEGSEHITATLPWDINNPQDRLKNDNYKSYDYATKTSTYREPKEIHIWSINSHRNIVTDFPGRHLTRSQAAKIIQHDPEFAGTRVTMFVGNIDFARDLFGDDAKIVSWNDIKSVKVVRKQRHRVADKQNGRYLGYMVHKKRTGPERYLGANGRVYYISKTELNQISASSFPREDFKLILVTPANQEKFAEKHPHAKSMMKYIRDHRVQVINHVENSSYIGEAIKWRDIPSFFKNVDIKKIKNKEIADAIKRGRTGSKWASLTNRWYGEEKMSALLDQKYPLISGYHRPRPIFTDHAIKYVNMIGGSNDA